MVSIGRGRGWAQNDKNPLPKPGRSLRLEDTEYTSLINIIDLAHDKDLSEKIDEIVKLITTKDENKQHIKDISDKLYEHALNDEEFALKLYKICTDPQVKDVKDSEKKNLFNHIVSRLQAEYEKRKDLQREDATKFRNTICFFSMFLSNLIQKHYQYCRFQSALLDYTEMLLETASEEDIKIFLEQLIIHGIHFQVTHRERLNELMIMGRETLVKDHVPLKCRLMLMYAIELTNRQFQPLPTDVQNFYELQLGKDFVQHSTHDACGKSE